jgi:hypothetical protein
MSVKTVIVIALPYPMKAMPNLSARRFETFKNVLPSTCPEETVR